MKVKKRQVLTGHPVDNVLFPKGDSYFAQLAFEVFLQMASSNSMKIQLGLSEKS